MTISTAALAVVLSGCAGGGGSSVSGGAVEPPPPPAPSFPPFSGPLPTGSAFTSWAGAALPGTYQLSGVGSRVSQTGLYLSKFGPWGPVFSGGQDVFLTFNASGVLTDAAVGQDEAKIFSTEAPAGERSILIIDTFDLGSGSLVAKQLLRGDDDTFPRRWLSYADPASLGLSYQTFGWWGAAQWAGNPDSYGSFSAGAQTPGQAIPTSGTAQFAGALSVEFLNAGSIGLAAPVTINVDFAARSAAFSAGDFRDSDGGAAAGTALSGTLTYASQTNALSGQLTSLLYAGPANARFYGPAAQEIGGSFVLTPTDPNANGRVVGAFGARR